ncbi:MAG: YeeE/YedE thiosulfate transporter family protein [Desulfobacteraceae bacterium]|nr:YeeE/YedE thiosulfate transporter family protein [Desulfobacteraceae bacterium]
MAEESIFLGKMQGLYKKLCQDEWSANTVGIIVGLFSVLLMAWWRPWGAVGAVRNWGDWILYGIGVFKEAPKGPLMDSGSVIGIGFVAGAFISANLGSNFAIRVPPAWERVKAVFAGIFMGIGATLAGGCNVGGFYNAIGNLSASGFAMWVGLIFGAIAGLKYIYWEMEHITWGTGGGTTVELPRALQVILGVICIAALIWGAHAYSVSESSYAASLGGLMLLSAVLGYSMQRGRWCMIQGFREPHMTGDCTMAKSVALSICIVAIGATVLKYHVPERLRSVRDTFSSAMEEVSNQAQGVDVDAAVEDVDGIGTLQKPLAVLSKNNYVRGTFGWGGVVGGLVFGFGAMLAGGCGTGTLWRVGEGQVKLWIVVPFFAISNALMTKWFRAAEFEANGKLGARVFLPDTFLGYGGTLALILGAMALWYVVVDWNEESNKLIVEM